MDQLTFFIGCHAAKEQQSNCHQGKLMKTAPIMNCLKFHRTGLHYNRRSAIRIPGSAAETRSRHVNNSNHRSVNGRLPVSLKSTIQLPRDK